MSSIAPSKYYPLFGISGQLMSHSIKLLGDWNKCALIENSQCVRNKNDQRGRLHTILIWQYETFPQKFHPSIDFINRRGFASTSNQLVNYWIPIMCRWLLRIFVSLLLWPLSPLVLLCSISRSARSLSGIRTSSVLLLYAATLLYYYSSGLSARRNVLDHMDDLCSTLGDPFLFLS